MPRSFFMSGCLVAATRAAAARTLIRAVALMFARSVIGVMISAVAGAGDGVRDRGSRNHHGDRVVVIIVICTKSSLVSGPISRFSF